MAIEWGPDHSKEIKYLTNLVKTFKEIAEGLTQQRSVYIKKFVDSVVELDAYLARKEIAENLGMTENALNVMIHRAKKIKDKE